jgi:hypothetical protein
MMFCWRVGGSAAQRVGAAYVASVAGRDTCPLMIGGIFGALIALERAVALAAMLRSPRHPSFLVPMTAGLGGLLLILDGAVVTCPVVSSINVLLLLLTAFVVL